MTNTEQGVKSYFEQNAEAFDAVYGERNILQRAFNQVFRPSLYQRLDLAAQEVASVPNAHVLDVGSGSGRTAVALARAGAKRVVGIDFSQNMVRLAHDLAGRTGAERVCEFVEGDFMTYEFTKKFDVTVALGVLDYVQHAEAFLRRMRRWTQQKAIVSAPGPSPIRAPLRRWRYARKGCPVFFYEKQKLVDLMRDAGFEPVDLHPFGPGAVVVGHVTPHPRDPGDPPSRNRPPSHRP